MRRYERGGALPTGNDDQSTDTQLQQRSHSDGIDNVAQLSSADLQRAINAKYRVENPNFVSSYQVVVSAVVERGEGGVSGFVKAWKRHFLDTGRGIFLLNLPFLRCSYSLSWVDCLL